MKEFTLDLYVQFIKVKFSLPQTAGLKVSSLSEPKLTQSLSQSSSADVRPPLPLSALSHPVLGDQASAEGVE